MSRTRVVLVAEWDGWCGACADERPLVLTRTGRAGLLSWWPGAGSRTGLLTLTCRLCGVSVPVPAEEDDADVLPDADGTGGGRT